MNRRQLLNAAAAVPLLPSAESGSSPPPGPTTPTQNTFSPASGLGMRLGLPKRPGTSSAARSKDA